MRNASFPSNNLDCLYVLKILILANIKESDEILKLKSEAQVELVNNQFGRKNISSLSSVNFK